MRQQHAGDNTSNLARLIRRSPLLDTALRQHWLRVLPYLTPTDRRRLGEILQAGAVLDAAIAPPTPDPNPTTRGTTAPES